MVLFCFDLIELGIGRRDLIGGRFWIPFHFTCCSFCFQCGILKALEVVPWPIDIGGFATYGKADQEEDKEGVLLGISRCFQGWLLEMTTHLCLCWQIHGGA